MEIFFTSSPLLFADTKAAIQTLESQARLKASPVLKSSYLSIGAKTFGRTCIELKQLGNADVMSTQDLVQRLSMKLPPSVLSCVKPWLKTLAKGHFILPGLTGLPDTNRYRRFLC